MELNSSKRVEQKIPDITFTLLGLNGDKIFISYQSTDKKF